MKAKAAVFMGSQKDFEVRSFDIAPTPAGYARMELIASGVCGTDIHIHNGVLSAPAPSIIGHEFVGRIVDVNEAEAAAAGLALGDAVIADIAVPCGECLLCKSGDDANCVNMQVTNGGSIDEPPYLYGGYSEINYTPLSNLIKIPETVDPTVAATLACPGPTGMHAFSLAAKAGISISGMRSAVVQGLGPVGVFALMYLKQAGVKNIYVVTASENERREQLAMDLGAKQVFCLARDGEENITRALQAENDGLGVDLCFESSGAPQALVMGLEILRNRGVYLIPGQYSNSGGVTIQPQIITFKALQILGSSQYSFCDVRQYLSFLAEHPALHPIIAGLSTRYGVDEINQAFADAKSGKNIKTLLVKK